MRLGQPEYQEDFGRRMGLGDGADSWKIERLQAYDESGFPSWEAFLAGDWEAALALIEAERAGFARFYRGFAARGASFRRVRIVEAPVSAYVQWEFQVLRVRAECGELGRVLDAGQVADLEAGGPLPELVSLGGQTLYQTLYAGGVPAGAMRYTDPRLIERYQRFAARLYASGEDVTAYFDRAIAPLPPPANALAEAAVDVVRGARVLRVFEDVLGGARLDDAAGLVSGGQEERAVVRDPLCLLHVVGDDDDRDLGGDLGDGLLDPAG
jgi:hypothetical protein